MAAAGAAVVVFFFDPAQYGFYPICLFHSLTGWNCPGCGATRAVFQLLHGHLQQAFRDNALVIAGLAAVPIGVLWHLIQRKRGRPGAGQPPIWVWWTLLALVLVFTVLRNVPAFGWLSP